MTPVSHTQFVCLENVVFFRAQWRLRCSTIELAKVRKRVSLIFLLNTKSSVDSHTRTRQVSCDSGVQRRTACAMY